jgi:hypothetical protein
MNTEDEPGVILTDEKLRATILDAAAREPSATRSERRRQSVLLLGLGTAAALAIFELWGGARADGRPPSLILATVSGGAVLAATASVVALRRGRSMLGRSPWLLVAAMVLLPVALVLWKTAVSSLYDGMTAVWPARPGFRCLTLALQVGMVPLALALVARRRADPVQPAISGAAIGAACGVAAAALVDLWCPVAYLPHLLLGHLLPVALLTLAGGIAGSRLLAIHFRLD